MSGSILTYENVTVRYRGKPEPAVAGLTLPVPEGEVTAVAGGSGSGKSTLLRLAMGLLPAGGALESGRVLTGGEDIAGFSRKRLRLFRGGEVAMVFQDAASSFDPRRTLGMQFIEYWKAHRPGGKREALAAAAEALAPLGFPDPEAVFRRYPFELSGGQLQRAAIGMAVMVRPKLLLCDEPTSALDPVVQAEVAACLMEVHRREGAALLLVTHNLGLAAAMADWIAVMEKGHLVEYGPKEAVIRRPQSAYTRKLLDSVMEVPRDGTDFVL